MSLITFAQNLANFIIGPFGISMITFCIALAAIAAALEFHNASWTRVFQVVIAGAILFSSGWIVTTWLGA